MLRVVEVTFPWVCGAGVALLVGIVVVLAMPSNATARVALASAVLSPYECETIVAASEAVAAQRGGWETERHRHYPTTDFALRSVPAAELMWNQSIRDRVLRTLEETVGKGLGPLHADDVFIVKFVFVSAWNSC